MPIGVPKKIKVHEYRVGLTPEAVREYVAAGHEVLVETGAGGGIGAGDDAYSTAGATIAATADEVFARAGMIVKVEEPQAVERARLREAQILFTYLHLAPDPDQTRSLARSGCTAVAYETATDRAGGLPLLASMSEVAGLPFGLALAAGGLEAIAADPHLAAGLNVRRGRITNRAVAGSLGTDFTPVDATLAA